MIDFVETLKAYCAASDLEYKEGICDMGYVGMGKETEAQIKKDAGYKAAILYNGKEITYGFSPINVDGLTDENKEGAARSLLYSLVSHALTPHL